MGEVRTAGGGPIPGAVLTSPGCEAVTDASGRFRVACAPGTRSFQVIHPEHLDRTWLVRPAGTLGDLDVGAVELAAIPLGGGLWLAGDGALERLPAAPLQRTATADAQRWCMEATAGAPVEVAPNVRLLDNRAVDWRMYRLDADACAYRMARRGDHWTWSAERVPVGDGEPLGPGRAWVFLELEPGDYAIVEWYEGFFVPEGGERYRGHWLRVLGPSAPRRAGEVAADAALAPPSATNAQ